MYDGYFSKTHEWFRNKPTEHVHLCYLCGESNYEYLFGEPLYYRCECGFAWRADMPTDESLKEFYMESAPMTEWARIKLSELERIRQADKFRFAVDFIKTKGLKNTLDYGCGNGTFLSYLVDDDSVSFGVEANEEALRISNGVKGVSAVRPAEIGALQMDFFNVLSLWGVIEHLKDPLQMIGSLKKFCVSDSYLVACVPNLDSLVIQRLKYKCCSFVPQHLYFFNKQTLDRLLYKSGYTPVAGCTIEPEYLPVAKMFYGLDPYAQCGELDFRTPLLPTPEQICASGAGYKIISIYKRK